MKHNFNSISQVEKDRILEMHIRRVLEEQGTSLNVGGNFQQGQNKTLKSGQAAGENAKAFLKAGLKTAKETTYTIGKTILRVIFTGVGIICAIGYAVFKVAEAIVNALTKFLTATGKVVISAAKAVGEATISVLTIAFQKLGIAIKAGGDFIASLFKSLKDGAYNLIVSCLKALKQFGIMVWGKILVMASTVKEFGQNVWNWCKQQFTAISKQIGMAWDSAVNLAKQGWSAVKNLGSQAVEFGKKAANKVADVAGQTWGAVKGFAQGLFEDAILFYETYISIRNSDTLALISECSKITKNVIL
jgi:hypothetical protein